MDEADVSDAVVVYAKAGWAESALKRTIFLNLFDPFAIFALWFPHGNLVMVVVDVTVQIITRDGNGCSVPKDS